MSSAQNPSGALHYPNFPPPFKALPGNSTHLGSLPCYFLPGIPSSLAPVHLSNSYPLFMMQPKFSSAKLFLTPLACPTLYYVCVAAPLPSVTSCGQGLHLIHPMQSPVARLN